MSAGSILYQPQPVRITDVGSWNLSSLLGNYQEPDTNMVQIPYPSAPPSDSIPERNIPASSKTFTLFGQRIELPTSMDMDCDSGTVNKQNVAVAAPSAPSVANISQMNTKIFPKNVKKMLLTGIFEGVPVKYTSWARDKKLSGLIKFNNVVSAKVFESHAGCKTKHPNDRIYFANGKSLFEVAQELQNTPEIACFK